MMSSQLGGTLSFNRSGGTTFVARVPHRA
jgi:hypothetical protein